MNIREASRITAISADMIRYYEKIGLISPGRAKNGYRDFNEDDLNTLVLIRMLSSSRIPLKRIRECFVTGSVESLLAELDTELEEIRRQKKELEVRELAVEIETEHFRQYLQGNDPVLYRYPDRWLLWRGERDNPAGIDRTMPDALGSFQYTAGFEAWTEGEEVRVSRRKIGILSYSPFPGSFRLPAQYSLRFVVSHVPGEMVGEEALADFVRRAMRYAEKDRYLILGYQFFRSRGREERCIVCLEVLLGTTVRFFPEK